MVPRLTRRSKAGRPSFPAVALRLGNADTLYGCSVSFAPLAVVALAAAVHGSTFTVTDPGGLTLTLDHPEASRCVLTVGQVEAEPPPGCAGLDLPTLSGALERLPHKATRMVWLRHDEWALAFGVLHMDKPGAEGLSAEAIDEIADKTEGSQTPEGRVTSVRAESASGRKWELVQLGGRPAAHFVVTITTPDGELWSSVYLVPARGELMQLAFYAPKDRVPVARPVVASIVADAKLPPASYPAFGKPESLLAKVGRHASPALINLTIYGALGLAAVVGGLWLRGQRRRRIALSGHVRTTRAPELLVRALETHGVRARSGHFSGGAEWVMVEPDLMLLERDGAYEVSGASSDAGLRAASALADALRAENIPFRFERRRGDGVSLGVDELAAPEP